MGKRMVGENPRMDGTTFQPQLSLFYHKLEEVSHLCIENTEAEFRDNSNVSSTVVNY